MGVEGGWGKSRLGGDGVVWLVGWREGCELGGGIGCLLVLF